MKPLSTNIALWFLAGSALFAGLFAVAGYNATVLVLAALIFGASVIIMVTWASTAWVALKSGLREGEALLGFAIFGLAVYADYTRVWAVTRVALGDPEWMRTSPIGIFAGVLLLTTLTAIILAPGTRAGVIPRLNTWYLVVVALIAGVIIGGALGVALSGRLSALEDRPISISDRLDKPAQVAAFCRKEVANVD